MYAAARGMHRGERNSWRRAEFMAASGMHGGERNEWRRAECMAASGLITVHWTTLRVN